MLLASKRVAGTYSATGCGAPVRSSAASLRDDGRLESSCWARGTSSVRIPVGNEGSAGAMSGRRIDRKKLKAGDQVLMLELGRVVEKYTIVGKYYSGSSYWNVKKE